MKLIKNDYGKDLFDFIFSLINFDESQRLSVQQALDRVRILDNTN